MQKHFEKSITFQDQGIINRSDDRRVEVEQKRLKTYPHNCIGLLQMITQNGKSAFGTAFLVSSNLVVTSAHLFYFQSQGTCQNVAFRPLNFYPDPSVHSKNSCEDHRTPTNFNEIKDEMIRSETKQFIRKILKQENIRQDFALIKLEYPVKRQKYISILPDHNDVTAAVSIYGYPIDKIKSLACSRQKFKQYGHQGQQIRKISDGMLFHTIDTFGGQSGSPLLVSNKKGELSAIGIHKATWEKGLNVAKPFTAQTIIQLKKWQNQMGGQPLSLIEAQPTIIKGVMSTKNEKQFQLFQKAKKHYDLQNYDQAIKCLQKAIKTNKSFVGGYLFLGKIKTEQQQNTQAIDYLSQAIELDPHNTEGYLLTSVNNMNQNDQQQALKMIKKVLKISPSYSIKMVQNYYFELIKQMQIKHFKQLQADDWTINVTAYERVNENILKIMLELSPKNAICYYKMAFIDSQNYQVSHIQGILQRCRNAIKYNQKYLKAYKLLIILLLDQKRLQEIQEICKKLSNLFNYKEWDTIFKMIKAQQQDKPIQFDSQIDFQNQIYYLLKANLQYKKNQNEYSELVQQYFKKAYEMNPKQGSFFEKLLDFYGDHNLEQKIEDLKKKRLAKIIAYIEAE